MLSVWNLNLAAAFIGVSVFGGDRGWEAGEMPLANVIVITAILFAVTVQILMTIARRRETPLYVSLWYLIGALVWTDINLVLLIIGPYHTVPGINNAALHGLYIHYVVGLWITPAGYVLIYFFLPASIRAPIYSHRLSLIGFWWLAFFYPFVGIHHYLFSPIADWAQTIAIVSSMMLIIPVWTVLQNFFGTMLGHWQGFGRNLPPKFLIMGSIMYLIGCFQGSTEALRSIQEPTHFTDFVVSHSHLTVFGTFVVWAIGGSVYVWPRLWGRELWSYRLGNWSFWLITLGISTMGLVLTAQGLQQGYMLMARAEWVDTVVTMKPFWLVRTLWGSRWTSDLAPRLQLHADGARGGAGSGRARVPVRARARRGREVKAYVPRRRVRLHLPGDLHPGHPPHRDPGVPRDTGDAGGPHGLGEVKWVWYESSPYTPLEQVGRSVYQREGCWYCHSQYVRPVTGEDMRWGPVSQVGEYAHDWPHLLSTRRIGPDLTRVGLKYGDAWHCAHHWVPTAVVPDSMMPSLRWLYRTAQVAVVEKDGGAARWRTAPRSEPLHGPELTGLCPLHPSPDGTGLLPPRRGDAILDMKNLPDPYDKLEPRRRSPRRPSLVPTRGGARPSHLYIAEAEPPIAGRSMTSLSPRGPLVSLLPMGLTVPPEPGAEVRRPLYDSRCIASPRAEEATGNSPVRTPLDCRPPRDYTPPEPSSSGRRRRARCRPTATSTGRSRAACAGRRCPPGTSCPRRTGIAVMQLHQDVLHALDGGEAASRRSPIGGSAARPRRSCVARGKELYAQGQVLPVPRRRAARATGPRPTSSRTTWGSRSVPTDFTRGPVQGRRRTSATSSGR